MGNESVKNIQRILQENGYDLGIWGIDGVLGRATKNALMQFQKDSNIKADGIAGTITLRELMFLKFPNFESREFSCKCKGKYCRGFPSEPDENLISLLEKIRGAAGGKPLIINSAIRCEKHNEASGGEPGSLHLKGLAADIRIPGISIRDLRKICIRMNSNGGCGISYKDFVHVDVGSKRIW